MSTGQPDPTSNPGPPAPPDDLAARLDALRESTAKARVEQDLLNRALHDAEYQQAAADLARILGLNRQLTDAQREQASLAARRATLADGSYAREAEEGARRRREATRVGRREEAVGLDLRRRDLAAGAFAQDLRDQAAADRTRKDQEEAERAARIGLRREDVATGRYAEAERPRLANDLAERQAADEERAARAALRHQDVTTGRYADRHATRVTADAADRRADLAELGVRHRFEMGGRRVAVASGRYGEEHEAQRAMEIDRERMRLAERLAYVRSGGYGRELTEVRRLKQQEQTAAAAERRAQLEAKYGRTLGGAADRFGGLARAGERVGGAVLGTGVGMAMSGMNNTVEMNQFSLQFMLLSREMAGAFKPALDAATQGLRGLREFLHDMGPLGQQLIRVIGYTIALNMASRFTTGQGLGTWLGRGAAVWGGGGGRGAAAAATGTGGSIFGMGAAATTTAAAGRGAWLWSRAAPAAAAAAAAAAPGVAGTVAAAETGAIGVTGATAAGTATTVAAGGSLLGRVGGWAGKALGAAGRFALPITAAMSAMDAIEGDYYDVQRAKGHSKLTSGIAALGGGFANTVSFGAYREGLNEHGDDKDLYRDKALRDQKIAEEKRKQGMDDPKWDRNYYQLYRESGASKVGATLGYGWESLTEGTGLRDVWSGLGGESAAEHRERLLKEGARDLGFKKDKGKMDSLTPAGGANVEVGSTYYEQGIDLGMATVGKGPDRSNKEELDAILKLLRSWQSSDKLPSPPPLQRGE